MRLKWTWTEELHDVSRDNEHEVEIFVTAEDEDGGEDPLALAHTEALDHIQRILERRRED
jgi:hypothetical protein